MLRPYRTSFAKLSLKIAMTYVPKRWNHGFTLVEVMVSMIIVTTFLVVTMQIFLSAAVLRAKASEYNEAYNWIQEDYEKILTKAQTYEMHAQPYSTLCNPLNPDHGLAASFVGHQTQGLGGASVNLDPRAFGGQTFSLVRTADYARTVEPNRLIALTYELVNVSTNQTVLEMETKVMIYAAFNCPFAEN